MFAHQHDPNAEYKIAGKQQTDWYDVGSHSVHVRVFHVHEGAGQQTIIDCSWEDFGLIS